jgi:hypothetical protein
METETIRLTEAQQSALECRREALDPVLAAAWDGARRLTVTPETRDALFSELTDAANAEDADAEQNPDPTMATFARRACRSLSAISGRVLKGGR